MKSKSDPNTSYCAGCQQKVPRADFYPSPFGGIMPVMCRAHRTARLAEEQQAFAVRALARARIHPASAIRNAAETLTGGASK